jgi:prepilin-type processing-associated H-X9-DG protein
MRQWGLALAMYEGDYQDKIPPYEDISSENPPTVMWFNLLAPYVVSQAAAGPTNMTVYFTQCRKCPGGSTAPPPFLSPSSLYADGNVFGWTNGLIGWNCWIGVYMGQYAPPLTGPFYLVGYSEHCLSATSIRNPSEAMAYMDTTCEIVMSPLWLPFDIDVGHFGQVDSNSGEYAETFPFNAARPTVHSFGANVTLLDGHVERVPFKQLWAVDKNNNVTCPYWYLKQF